MHALNLNKDGVSIIFAIFVLLLLSVLALAIFSMISSEVESAAMRLNLFRIQGIAEAGLEIGGQAVSDDKVATDGTNTTDPSANGYCGISYLEGGFGNKLQWFPTTGAYQPLWPELVVFHGANWNNSTPSYAVIKEYLGSYITIWNFEQRVNLIGSKLIRARIVLKARKDDPAGSDPTVRLEYTLDAGSIWHPDPSAGEPTVGFDFTIDNGTWPSSDSNYRFSSPLSIDWQDIMKNNGADFRIRIRRLDAVANPVYVDWLALEILTEVDTLTEPWSSNTYINLPADLGKGTIEHIIVTDESGKININYAPRITMYYLFRSCGIPLATAWDLAGKILFYRSSKMFDTIEEVKRISGMTDQYFNRIDQDITVYSWVDDAITRSENPMALVNINTASVYVLRSIIKCAELGVESRINEVVGDIIAQRRTAPFVSMYSSYETQQIGANRDLQSFSGFLQNLSYPWLDDNMRNRIRNIADGSSYNIGLMSNWANNNAAGGVGFCYSSYTFLVTSKGKSQDIERTVVETYGNHYLYEPTYKWSEYDRYGLPAYKGDRFPIPYWRMKRR